MYLSRELMAILDATLFGLVWFALVILAGLVAWVAIREMRGE